MNCVSNIDAVAANVLAGAVIAVNAAERISDRRQGITRLERSQRTWLRNRAFMIDMGLDPIAVLGPPPGVVPQPAKAAPSSVSVLA